MFIDGDFTTGQGDCKYHCSPSCHPLQVGPEWVYGCKHEAWPQNRAGDFVPIVECGGMKKKCDLVKMKWLYRYILGLNRRKRNCENKINEIQIKITEIKKMKEARHE